MTLRKEDLGHFTGTERWFRHTLNRQIAYTEGVQYVAKAGGAYWLIDKIASMQLMVKFAREEFQSWKLVVDLEKHIAVLSCEDGNCNTIYQEGIAFTDFPLDTITLWCISGIILLPSEY